jgi:hypothetical protein
MISLGKREPRQQQSAIAVEADPEQVSSAPKTTANTMLAGVEPSELINYSLPDEELMEICRVKTSKAALGLFICSLSGMCLANSNFRDLVLSMPSSQLNPSMPTNRLDENADPVIWRH